MSSTQFVIEQSLPKRPLRLWPLATLPLSTGAVWAINTGGEALRWLLLGGIGWALALPLLLSLEAGLLAMLLFEPVRGFVRRAQYLFLPYTQTDPIHVITPLVTLLAFAMLLHRQRLQILRATPLAGFVSLLGMIYFLQIFNPLQGGLSVGLSGALFVLVPVAWFYFGQSIKPEFVSSMLRLIVIIGLVTSLYGVYHLAYGFPSFEQYWLDHTDAYESISVGHIKRALATYSSAEEWGRYIEIGAIVALGLSTGAVGYLRKSAWLLCGVALTLMLLFTGQRTAIFGLVVGVIALFSLGAQTWRGRLGRILLLALPALLIFALTKAPTNDDMLSHDEDERFQTVLSHSARGTLNPTKEGSLQERFKIWTYFATDVIPRSPLGLGLGATSLGARRFDSGTDLPPVDSYLISSVITCGLPAALLFMLIVVRAMAMSWSSCQRSVIGSMDRRTWRTVGAIMPALVLNSLFGNTFTLYSVAPIGWLLVGWISANRLKLTTAPTVPTI